MDLTPEERQRIYLEEKSRLEGLERLTPEERLKIYSEEKSRLEASDNEQPLNLQSDKPRLPEASKGGKLVLFLVISFLILVLIAVFTDFGTTSNVSSPARRDPFGLSAGNANTLCPELLRTMDVLKLQHEKSSQDLEVDVAVCRDLGFK